ncbi:MAG: DNA internalization-related competence protein ComEC/Rec2 [Desulfobulbaceae bacterium]|nr:DNA internalization-related competence protein ComEC/Rec2 [Desulfobulbaceae bacterium]
MNYYYKIRQLLHTSTINAPLPTATICYLSGVTAAYWCKSISFSQLFTFTPLIFAIPVAILLIYRHNSAFLWLFIILIGLAHGSLHLQPPGSPTHIYNLIPHRTTITLSGTLNSMPSNGGESTKFIIMTDGILFSEIPNKKKEIVPAHGLVRLTLAGQIRPEISVGDHLLVRASIDRITTYKTPGVFDYQLHMASKGIYVSGFVNSPTNIYSALRTDKSFTQSFRYLPEQLRYNIAKFLNSNLDNDTAGVYQALLIGDRSMVSPKLTEHFIKAGCMHILAISGLHMSLLALIIFTVTQWLLKRSVHIINSCHVPTIAFLLSIPPLLIYCLIAGMNTPALRAFLMAALTIFALVSRQQRALFHIISAAILFLTILNPLIVYTVSFQLSVAAVSGIALFTPYITGQFKDTFTSPDQTIIYRIFTVAKASILISMVATLSTLPFILHHFNRVSLIGPLANLILEPLLCLWSLPCGLISSILLPVSPTSSLLFLKLGTVGITLTTIFLNLIAKLPFSSVRTITPSITEWVIYIILLTFIIIHGRITIRKSVFAILTFSLVTSHTLGLFRVITPNELEIDFLDIGQGSSTFILTPKGHTILIDGGGYASRNFDPGERIIAPFLYANRIWRIDDIVITHPHADHYNGIPFIMHHFKPKRLWIAGKKFNILDYQKILHDAEKLGISVIAPQHERIIDREPNLEIKCQHINYGTVTHNDKINERGLIVSVRYGKNSLLFPGDIGSVVEQRLVNQNEVKQANILLASHHGSKYSCLPNFIRRVNPEIIVVSSGKNKQGQYPATEHMLKWSSMGIKWLVTSESGTIRCIMDEKKFTVYSMIH